MAVAQGGRRMAHLGKENTHRPTHWYNGSDVALFVLFLVDENWITHLRTVTTCGRLVHVKTSPSCV